MCIQCTLLSVRQTTHTYRKRQLGARTIMNANQLGLALQVSQLGNLQYPVPPTGVSRAATETAVGMLGLSSSCATMPLTGDCNDPVRVQSQPSLARVQFAAPDMRDNPPTAEVISSQCKNAPRPWTGEYANAPAIEAAMRNGTYVTPEQLFAKQPAVPTPCDNRAADADLTGTQNEFVAANGISPFGNVFWPQAMPPGLGPYIPPAGTIPFTTNLDPTTAQFGGPIATKWVTKPATEVRQLNDVVFESNSAAWLANQAWVSFGSAPLPGLAPP